MFCAGAILIAGMNGDLFAHGGTAFSGNAIANTAASKEFYLTYPQNLLDPSVTPNVLDA